MEIENSEPLSIMHKRLRSSTKKRGAAATTVTAAASVVSKNGERSTRVYDRPASNPSLLRATLTTLVGKAAIVGVTAWLAGVDLLNLRPAAAGGGGGFADFVRGQRVK